MTIQKPTNHTKCHCLTLVCQKVCLPLFTKVQKTISKIKKFVIGIFTTISSFFCNYFKKETHTSKKHITNNVVPPPEKLVKKKEELKQAPIKEPKIFSPIEREKEIKTTTTKAMEILCDKILNVNITNIGNLRLLESSLQNILHVYPAFTILEIILKNKTLKESMHLLCKKPKFYQPILKLRQSVFFQGYLTKEKKGFNHYLEDQYEKEAKKDEFIETFYRNINIGEEDIIKRSKDQNWKEFILSVIIFINKTNKPCTINSKHYSFGELKNTMKELNNLIKAKNKQNTKKLKKPNKIPPLEYIQTQITKNTSTQKNTQEIKKLTKEKQETIKTVIDSISSQWKWNRCKIFEKPRNQLIESYRKMSEISSHEIIYFMLTNEEAKNKLIKIMETKKKVEFLFDGNLEGLKNRFNRSSLKKDLSDLSPMDKIDINNSMLANNLIKLKASSNKTFFDNVKVLSKNEDIVRYLLS